MVPPVPQPHHNPPSIKLTAHSKGWVAKIGGKVKWLAPLHNKTLALTRYHEKMQEHMSSTHAAPVVAVTNAPLGQLGDLFLESKQAKVKAGELSSRTLKDYKTGVQLAVDHFDYNAVALNIPTHRWQAYRAHLQSKLDVHSLARAIGAIRQLSKWAHLNEYIDRPFRFGTEFSLPSQKSLRQAKKNAGPRVFNQAQVKTIITHADPVLRAAFLLALNGGIGNTDISKLQISNLKLDEGRIEFERSKTEVARVIPLWPETVRAIREAMPLRPEPKLPEHAARVFLTDRGHPLVRDKHDATGDLTSTTDAIGMAFWKLAKAKGVERSLYDGRRTFQTIGDERGPAHVVRSIMGHADRGDDMGGRYRQSIPFSEMSAVVNHVRKRLNVARMTWKAPEAPSKVKGSDKAKGQRAAKRGRRQRQPAGTAT